MGSSKKGQESTTQTQSTEPPAYLQPYLQYAGNAGHQLISKLGPQQYFQGNTVVPFSPQTNQALNLQQQRATGGSPVVDSAKSFTQNLLQGQSSLNQNFSGGPTGESFLSPFMQNNNPYLDATFDRAAGAVGRQLDTTLARSGRDLDANMGARADALNNLATNIYGGAYEGDRSRALSAASNLSNQVFTGGQGDLDRQLQAQSTLGSQQLSALGQALPLGREDYFDIAQLGGVGSAVEGQSQNIIQDRLNRFNFEQDAPFTALDRYIAQLAGTPQGQTTQSTTPIHRNPIGSALGGAATGASVGGPWGALIGGGLGLVSSYM